MRIDKVFYPVIKILLILNKKNRQRFPKNIYRVEDYALEFCTVKCDIGRQTGKSEYIKTHADASSVVIVMNNRMKQNFSIPNRKFELRSPSDLLNNPQKEFKTIYIDEPTYVFKKISVSKLYSLLSKNYDQTYIWLGM